METKTGKRIVSKTEYAVDRNKRTSFSFYGRATMLVGGLGLLVTCCGTIVLTLSFVSGGDWFSLVFFLIFILVPGSSFAYCFYAGRKWVKDAMLLDNGVLNTADLPAPDSLVRASEEPRQAQEAVLLRAAAQGVETPAEQLVRPAGEQETP